jgi:hypothetical protein
MKEIIIGVVILTLIATIPLALIWALNTLFSFTIAYTFKNWLAMLVLSSVIHGSTRTP